MRKLSLILVAVVLFGVWPSAQVVAQDKQIVIYMQCGGTQGDGATLARTNGARAAAAANNVKLIEQYSKWDQQKMIDRSSRPSRPTPTESRSWAIRGEPAMAPLVDDAEALGIIVTSGNNPLPTSRPSTRARASGTRALTSTRRFPDRAGHGQGGEPQGR